MSPLVWVKALLDSPTFNFWGAVVSVVFEIYGLVSNVEAKWVIPTAFGATVIFLGRLAATQYWEAHRLREQGKPKLQMLFEPGKHELYDSYHGTPEDPRQLRYLRVSVVNSGDSVHDVSVMLQRIEPRPQGVFGSQPLESTHERPGEAMANSRLIGALSRYILLT